MAWSVSRLVIGRCFLYVMAIVASPPIPFPSSLFYSPLPLLASLLFSSMFLAFSVTLLFLSSPLICPLLPWSLRLSFLQSCSLYSLLMSHTPRLFSSSSSIFYHSSRLLCLNHWSFNAFFSWLYSHFCYSYYLRFLLLLLCHIVIYIVSGIPLETVEVFF